MKQHFQASARHIWQRQNITSERGTGTARRTYLKWITPKRSATILLLLLLLLLLRGYRRRLQNDIKTDITDIQAHWLDSSGAWYKSAIHFSIIHFYIYIGNLDSSVSTVIALRTGLSGDQNTEQARNFPPLQNVHTGLEAHPASYSTCTEVISRR